MRRYHLCGIKKVRKERGGGCGAGSLLKETRSEPQQLRSGWGPRAGVVELGAPHEAGESREGCSPGLGRAEVEAV